MRKLKKEILITGIEGLMLENDLERFGRGMDLPKGKWYKVEFHYKEKQRTKKLLIDTIKITKCGRKK